MKNRLLNILLILFALPCLLSAQGRILTIGDSTMADYDVEKRSGENEMRGWGQMLPLFLTNGAESTNAAKNGRSSKSFYYEYWETLRESLRPGDYVFIQFGHNDEKNGGLDSDENDRSQRGTAAWGQYQKYLKLYVEESRAKGAIPVLLTPVVRRLFDDDNKLSGQALHSLTEIVKNDSTMNYPLAMRALAQELSVPLVDMTALTEAMVLEYGAEKSKEVIYARNDNTHLKAKGGILFARLAVTDLLSKGILTDYLIIPSDDDLFSSKLLVSEKAQKAQQRKETLKSLRADNAEKIAVNWTPISSNLPWATIPVATDLKGLKVKTVDGQSLFTTLNNKWADGDIDVDATRYVELSITPDSGTLYIDGLSLDLGAKRGAGMFCTVLGSTDPSFAKAETFLLMQPLAKNTSTKYQAETLVEVAARKTFYLRVYPWYKAAASNKYLLISDITVNGLLKK